MANMVQLEEASSPPPPDDPLLKPKIRTKKRKRTATPTPTKSQKPAIGLAKETNDECSSPSKKKIKATPKKEDTGEKRLRRFRGHMPGTYLEKLHRATTQRMFVIDRSRGGTDECPEETIDMAGTTGNVYSVNIGLIPNCTCPDNQKGNQCKHIVYVRLQYPSVT